MRTLWYLACGIALLTPVRLAADTGLNAPLLSAVSGFFAGSAPRKMERLEILAFGDLRDSVLWRDVTQVEEAPKFNQGSGASLSALAQKSLLGTVMLLPQTPSRNKKQTIIDPQDVAAFAQFARAVSNRFSTAQIEVANEFNGGAFVSGPAKRLTLRGRAGLYQRFLQAIGTAGVPKDRIIGGALHSLSGAYLWALLDAGVADHMGAVGIHPYTTEPEAFVRQLEVLRRHPRMARLEVDFTEFGTKDIPRAADFFWRAYCKMAEAGVRQTHWYPLDRRRDGYASLFTPDLELTSVGKAVNFARMHLAGRSVTTYAPDPHTHGCLFDERFLAIWGAPRDVQQLRKDLYLQTAGLNDLETHKGLARDQVLLIRATESSPPIDLGTDILLSPQTVVFDSFDTFTYPPAQIAHHMTLDGQRYDFVTCPGQDRPGAPWFPHLCIPALPRATLHDRGFTLPKAGVDLHLTHTLTKDAVLDVHIALTIHDRSMDGVIASLLVGGATVWQEDIKGRRVVKLGPIEAHAGTEVTLLIGSGPSAKGDRGRVRLRLNDAKLQ